MIHAPRKSLDTAYWFQEGPGVRTSQFRDQGVKLLNVSNITKTGIIDLSKSERFIDVSEANGKYSHFLADVGDMVIASSGVAIDSDGLLRTRGAFIEAEHLPLCMNTSTIRFKAVENVSDLSYLRHWLSSTDFRVQITKLVTGIAQKNFGPSHLAKVEIPLPPFDEQRRIAAILDQADTLRRRRKEAFEMLGQLRRSAFDDLFGDPSLNPKDWPIGRISDFTSSTQYGTSSKAGESGDFPILRMGNLTFDGGWKLTDLKFIDFAERDIEKYTVAKGDILFNRTNSPDLVGKTAVFREEKPYGFAGYLVRLRLKDLAEPDYVSAYLNSAHGKATLRGMCKSIIGMANINAKELVSIPIMLPPVEIQRSFSAIVAQTIESEKSQLAYLKEADKIFASLQKRAFSEEL